VMTPYLLGLPMQEDIKTHAFEEMGDLGYFITVSAKMLKVTLPGSGKKLKLVGTRGAAVLEMNKYGQQILSLSKKTFYGVQEMPNPKNPQRVVINTEKQAEVELEREAKMVTALAALIHVYYPLCYEMFGVPPANVFTGNIAKLQLRYPNGFFEQDPANGERDTPAEQATAKSAGLAAPVATSAVTVKAVKAKAAPKATAKTPATTTAAAKANV
jgi:hypothetical protein